MTEDDTQTPSLAQLSGVPKAAKGKPGRPTRAHVRQPERQPARNSFDAHDQSRFEDVTYDEIEIGGQRFKRDRASLTTEGKKTLDINPKLLNPDLHYHWARDEARAAQLKDKGYAEATRPELRPKRMNGKTADGKPIEAILMETPKIWYQERQALMQQQLSAQHKSIMQGKTDGKQALDSSDNFYMGTTSPVRL